MIKLKASVLFLQLIVVGSVCASSDHELDLKGNPVRSAPIHGIENNINKMKLVIAEFANKAISKDASDKIPAEYVIRYFGLTTPAGIRDFEARYHATLPEIIESGTFLGIFDRNFIKAQALIKGKSDASELDLSGSNLKALPLEIKDMANLKKLSVAKNGLIVFPQVLTRLANLVELDLSGNAIKDLPDNLSKMSSLEKLNLAGNQIEGLPASIGELKKLSDLNLSGNHLEMIPRTISNLANSLNVLDLRNNHLSVRNIVFGGRVLTPETQLTELKKSMPYTKIYLSGQTVSPHISVPAIISEIRNGQIWLNKSGFATIQPLERPSPAQIKQQEAREQAAKEAKEREDKERARREEEYKKRQQALSEQEKMEAEKKLKSERLKQEARERDFRRMKERKQEAGEDVKKFDNPDIIEDYNPESGKPEIPLQQPKPKQESWYWWPF